MADTPSSRSPGPPGSQSTRELLEELDTLMQRMLALPVEGTDDDSTTPLPASPRPSPQSAPPQSIHQLHVPVTKVTVQAPGTNRPVQHVAATEPPALRLAPTGRPTHADRDKAIPPEPAPTYMPVGAEPLLPMLLQRPATPPKKAAAPASPPPTPAAPAPRPALRSIRPYRQTTPPPAPEGMTWLVLLNRIFDLCTMLLGPLGGWLRGEQGRWLIGWSGIAMVIAAAIWAALRFFS